MKKIFIVLAAAGALWAAPALAQTPHATSTPPSPAFAPLPVTYPIVELGGCASRNACRAYCDLSANQTACLSFAQRHGLMSASDVARAKAFLESHASSTPHLLPPPPPPPQSGEGSSTIAKLLAKIKGPGGCTTQDACKVYCDDTAHQGECLAFAKAHALMSDKEISDAKQFLERVASSTPPLPPRGLSSTTPPGIKPILKRPFSDLPKQPLASTTYGAPPKSTAAAPDYSKPPYRCTPGQAEEGACDPDQFPGYVPPPAQSDQGGNILMGVLRFFGL